MTTRESGSLVAAAVSPVGVRSLSTGFTFTPGRWRALVAAALTLSVAAATWQGLIAERISTESVYPAAQPRGDLAVLPLQAQAPIASALGAEEPAYRASAAPGGFLAVNPTARLRARFDGAGVRVSSGPGWLGLQLRDAKYGGASRALSPAVPRAKANVVSYAHPGMSEWYSNGPLGLEQGFTIDRPGPGVPAGALTLSLASTGNLRPALAPSGKGITFAYAGRPTLRYANLVATDARGRLLPSSLALRAGDVVLRVDTRGARYPLRIDPLIQQAELKGGEESGSPRFGFSVALSADGNTALIGGLTDNNFVGAAWVFTRSGSSWSQQGPKLTGGEEVGAGNFGDSVALSSDGNTAFVGGSNDNHETGAAWVFTRSGSSWSQQGPKLTGGEEVEEGGGAGGSFGGTVALSADGNTALVGGDGDNHAAGAAWVFTRSGSSWSQQGPKLTGGGGSGAERFGTSVALSAEATTALVGGVADHSWAGAAWVFTRSGSTWSQQGPKLTGSEEVGEGLLGLDDALSADGNTALVGGPYDNIGKGGFGVGAAWVFTRSGSSWSQQGPKLTGGGEAGDASFGYAVQLASEGNTALIGGDNDNGHAGAVWEFTRSGSAWIQQGSKVTASGEVGPEGHFGIAVALSQNASTALIGGADNNAGTGAAWAFTASSGATERAEYKNWVLSGSITDKTLGQVITIPQGSTFNGSGELNSETGAGSVKGSLAVPPFTTTFQLFALLPVSVGMTLAQAAPLEGTVAKSETVAGDELLTIPAGLNLGVTSVGILGLTIPTNCTTTEPLALGLTDTLSREELLAKGWSFAGMTTLPRIKCEGGFLGGLFGAVLSALLSGPGNTYSLSVKAPGT
jgi:hypothetical protein